MSSDTTGIPKGSPAKGKLAWESWRWNWLTVKFQGTRQEWRCIFSDRRTIGPQNTVPTILK